MEGKADEFDWDAGNRGKGQKHAVEPSEVESLFHRSVFLAGRIVEPAHDEPRWLLLGETDTARADLHPPQWQAAADHLPGDAPH